MDLDRFKQRWQAVDSSITLKPEADDVVAKCRARLSQFKLGLLISDILEIGTGLVMAWVWAFRFTREFPQHKPLIYLGALAILFVCAVLAVARFLRHRNAKPMLTSVSDELRRQLYAVNQRTWLLKNVLWWYLTPCAVAIGTVVIAINLHKGAAKLPSLMWANGTYVASCILLFVFIYWLNQRAVRKYLLPLKEEIESVLRDIEGESAK